MRSNQARSYYCYFSFSYEEQFRCKGQSYKCSIIKIYDSKGVPTIGIVIQLNPTLSRKLGPLWWGSACSPSTLVIQVRIPLKTTAFIRTFMFERNNLNKKNAGPLLLSTKGLPSKSLAKALGYI